MQNTVIRVVTHPRPHLDEIFAFFLLRKYGEEVYPGISSAVLEFIPNGPAPEIPQDAIALGIGGGMFDEHPNADDERKQEECTATLVAKHLEVEKLPELQTLLRLVVNDDLKGAGYPIDISRLTKLMFEQGEDPTRVVEWALFGIEAKFQAEYGLHQVGRRAFDEHAEKIVISTHKGDRDLYTLDGNDDTQLVLYSKLLAKTGVVVNREPEGNVQIFLGQKSNLRLDRVAYYIRTAERELKRKSGELPEEAGGSLSTEEGSQEGNRVAGAEEWYYHPQTKSLLNGSKTATAVHPTRLPLELIVDCIREGLAR